MKLVTTVNGMSLFQNFLFLSVPQLMQPRFDPARSVFFSFDRTAQLPEMARYHDKNPAVPSPLSSDRLSGSKSKPNRRPKPVFAGPAPAHAVMLPSSVDAPVPSVGLAN
jgi:hypothetical protein